MRLPAGATHHGADVTTGEGLEAALARAEVVIDATNALSNAEKVLVLGTQRVIDAAHSAGAHHFIGISIVGIDDAPIAYYRTKVAQEKVVTQSTVPWSLLRATQFHGLVEQMVSGRFGVVIAPRGAKLQPVDVREVADHVLAAAMQEPAGRLPDVGGPEVRELGDLAAALARATGLAERRGCA